MDRKNFNGLIDKEGYQFFLFSSPVSIPINFAIHSWVVTNKKGKINRWEVWNLPNQCETSWGYVHLNLWGPSEGMRTYPYGKKLFESKLIDKIDGGENSIAYRIINFIDKNAQKYPFFNQYNLLGPNSNSFVQWILNKFPEANLNLPWNAFGKNYSRLPK